MGRPPCCDKVGIKKGPWTPEEDIILVSYIQEHGPGNWRSVPTNTGLSRCSKSCRLRWTNYLRPGIKRGNFTPHEEGMIIHLQALLGNKWAAIASYLPQRTDNDIKNYWNTHLKKKIKKQYQSNLDAAQIPSNSAAYQFVSKMSFRSTRRTSDADAADAAHDHENGKPTHHSALLMSHQQKNSSLSPSSSSSVYASSEENISRLLEGWMRSSPKKKGNNNNNGNKEDEEEEEEEEEFHQSGGKQCYRPHHHDHDHDRDNEAEVVVCCKDELDSFLSFENLNSLTGSWDKSSSPHNCTVVQKDCDEKSSINNNDHHHQELQKSSKLQENNNNNNPPPALSFLENWLLEESIGQVEEGMEIPSIF